MFWKKYKYNWALCANFRDEAKILSEWIAYYRSIGVDHFFLYNHLSTDNFQSVLDPYIKQKIVTLNHIPKKEWIHRGQWQRESYNHFLKNYGQLCKWCGYFDLDEFLVPVQNTSIPKLLDEFDRRKVGAIEIKWQCFGTSFVPIISGGELYTEQLTLKAKPEHHLNSWGKVIAKPKYQLPWPVEFPMDRKQSIHHAVLKKRYVEIPLSLDFAQLNHYFMRDQEFFYNVRVKSRKNSEIFTSPNVSIEEIEKDFNKFGDKKIQKFIPEIRKKIGSLSNSVSDLDAVKLAK